MTKTTITYHAIFAAGVLLSGCQGEPETPVTQAASEAAEPVMNSGAELQAAALAAMHAENITKLDFTASGWEGCLGQPWRIDEGWARWELTDYVRVIDYSNNSSLQTAQRRAAMDPDKIGGCGASPGAMPVPQQSSITSASPWANQLSLWLTPQGFLKLATENDTTIIATDDGWTATLSTTQGGVTYPLTGYFNKEFLLEKIDTRLDNSVYGDMLMEAEFSSYKDFNGLLFPTLLVQKQGGFPILSLEVSSVTPNSPASTEAPARPAGPPGGGGGGAAAPAVEPFVQVVPGIFVSNGGYQSVFVEFADSIVVIDGLQSDDRSAELIAQAKQAIPGKPIGYVITTHNHFDHANGLRAFVAEGATIVTHKINEEFFNTALSNPRTLEHVDPQALPVKVLGVDDFYDLTDGNRHIELYRLQGSVHADDMMIAYLPEIKTIVEADVLQPWISPQFNGNYEGGHPFLVHLADELERLNIDYTQFVPVHRPAEPPFMTKADLMMSIGREE
ncbi:MAG: MBL fold metallo-hydrolase [Pseudomonadota bacterium]